MQSTPVPLSPSVHPSSRSALRFTALFALASITCLMALWGADRAGAAEAAAESTGVIDQRVESSPAEIESRWTKQDFLNAIPADTPPGSAGTPEFSGLLPDSSISARPGDFLFKNPTALPQRLHGKVFFKRGDLIYSCSATLISSRYGNSVFTAGHCVYDVEAKSFVRDFVFLPGYEEGTALGIYPATTLATTRNWIRTGSFAQDIGIATLAGTPVADMGGARPVAFKLNPKRRKFTIYGYPGDPEPIFDGENLYGCRSKFAGRDRKGRPANIAAYPCHMGHGTSGGAWITHGYLNSVSSYIYCEQDPRFCGYLFGPYFGKAARKLFTLKQVGGSIDPWISILKHPKRKTSKRKVRFRFSGLASTPLRYRCKFDHRRYVRCGSRTTISRLSRGRHSLRIKAVDQTGRRARNSPRFKFVVKR